MPKPSADDDKPPKKLGRGLSEVSHIFLSEAERRRYGGLHGEATGCAGGGQRSEGGGIPADQSCPGEAAEDGSALGRQVVGNRDRGGAPGGPRAESAAAEGRIERDDDLWLPRAVYISVTSGERVRGKTLLAANLAYGLLARGRRVALVNADSDRPDIVDVTGSSRAEPAGDMISRSEGFGGIAAVDVVGLSMVSGDAERDRSGGALGGAGVLHGLELAGREAQIVIIDTSPWADHSRAVWRIAALSIVVAEPGSDRMRSAYVTIKRIRAASPNARIGLVLNCVRSYAEGEDCFRKLAEVCRRFLKTNLRNYGYVLHDAVVSEAYETATPLVRAFPDSKAAKCIEAILELIVMDGSAIARRRREVTYEECALRKGRLQALKSSAF